MIEVLYFIVGGVITGAVMAIRQRTAHGAKKRADEQHYKQLWLEAVELLNRNGQLTNEQLKQITPASQAIPLRLTRKKGSSFDRSTIEVARAEAGLPPADNLKGMSSFDIKTVRAARIKNGTER